MGGGVHELALFAGGGGGILGGRLLGWRTVCAVEIDPYARRILLARQRDGMLEPFPIWDDVTTFDGRPWRGRIDVVSGGFPCQDISSAGKGAGIDGERSGLWEEMARIIREVRPRYVFVENSPMLTSRGLGRVLGDLAEMGFDAEYGVLGAYEAGAPHKRDRIWILACNPYSNSESIEPVNDEARGMPSVVANADRQSWAAMRGQREAVSEEDRSGRDDDGGSASSIEWERPMERAGQGSCDVTDTERDGLQGVGVARVSKSEGQRIQARRSVAKTPNKDNANRGWWETEPAVGRVANGVAHRVDRLRALGNGQVPAVAALAWRVLKGRIDGSR